LSVIAKVVLLVIVLEGSFEPLDVLRQVTKRFVLETVDTMHSACQVGSSLFYCFSFTCPVPSGFIKRDPIRNVSDMVVQLPVASVPIVSFWFFDLGAASRRINRGCSRSSFYQRGHGLR
jgi:hypothetical protein